MGFGGENLGRLVDEDQSIKKGYVRVEIYDFSRILQQAPLYLPVPSPGGGTITNDPPPDSRLFQNKREHV